MPISPHRPRAASAARLLAAFALTLVWPAPAASAQAEVTKAVASERALAAFGVGRHTGGEIVFVTAKPVPGGTAIREGGPRNPVGRRDKLGVSSSPARRIATVGRAGAWLFYDDRAPFQAYQHPGRVALVDRSSGRATLTPAIDWPPLLGDRLPDFMRSRAAYLDPANRAFYRPYATGAAATRAGTAGLRSGRTNAEPADAQAAADLIAAEHSCSARFSDTLLGDFYDFGSTDVSRAMLGSLLRELSELDPGFHTTRYTAETRRSPQAFVRRFVTRNGCKHVLLYLSGGGYEDEDAVNVGLRSTGGRVKHQDLGVAALRALIGSYATVTFSVVVDAPWSRGMSELADLPNVLITAAPSGARRGAFGYLPEVEQAGRLVSNTRNEQELREYTNRLLAGLSVVMRDPAEVELAARLQREGRIVSTLAWFIARALDRASTLDFPGIAGIGGGGATFTPFTPIAPDGATRPLGDLNHAPFAEPQMLAIAEDETATIRLGAHDQDGNALAFAVTTPPRHGTLVGTAPDVLYVPDHDFHGTDAFEFVAGDGGAVSAPAAVAVTVAAVDDAPVAQPDAATVDEDHLLAAPDPGLLVNDTDAEGDPLTITALDGLTVLTGSTAGGAAVTLAPAGGYSYDPRGAFDSLGPGQSATDVFTYGASNGSAATATGTGTATMTVTGVNDAGVLSGGGGTLAYTEASGAQPVGGTQAIADVDSPTLAGATVVITAGLATAEDRLGFADTGAITSSYDVSSGTLTLAGSASRDAYEAALRAITYRNLSSDPSTAMRTLTYRVDDGYDVSSTVTRDITVTAADDAPDVSASTGTASFTENGTPAPADPGLTVADVDSATLSGATARITTGFASAQDTLDFTASGAITGGYDSATGVLTLAGGASPAAYQAVLRSVTYANGSDDPTGATRTVRFTATDTTALTSAPATRIVSVVAVNDAPVLASGGNTVAYTEDDGARLINSGLTVTDIDDANIESATVSFTSSFDSEDELTFSDQNGISGTWHPGTRVLNLAGSATKASYQTALRSVRYVNNDHAAPSAMTRTVAFVVADGTDDSNTASTTITVTPSADAPVLTAGTANTSTFEEHGTAVIVDDGIAVSDVDSTVLTGATITISAGRVTGDTLAFSTQNGITGAYNSATGVLTLSGLTSLANYQTALRSITFSSTSDDPGTSRTVSFAGTDGVATSNAVTHGITVTPVP